MTEGNEKVYNNSQSSTINRAVITGASILLAVTGYVDIKNIDKTYDIVVQMKANQEEFLKGLGISSNASGQYFKEIHDTSEDNSEMNQRILQELEVIRQTLDEHHLSSPSKNAKQRPRDYNG